MHDKTGEPYDSGNRRNFSRVDFHHDILLKNEKNQTFRGSFSDISLKGMLFQGNPLPTKGDKVSGDLHLGEVHLMISGTVVQASKERGAAIRFQDLDVESFSHLRRLVSLNLGDSETIDQEFFSSL